MKLQVFVPMVLPPFDPPQLADLERIWRRCSYDDVHVLIFEVLHQRVTFRELTALGRDATRLLGAEGESCRPLRKMNRQLFFEMERGGSLLNRHDPIAPFSDNWLARDAVRRNLYSSPSEPDPGTVKVHQLPEFMRVTWCQLRAAWHDIGRRPPYEQSVEQRLVLETVLTRRIFRRALKLARAAEATCPQSPELKLLR